jgi:hypothetical protein
MSKNEKRIGAFLILLVLAGAAGTLLMAFSSGPPLAHTGAFGEPTCLECHVGNALNAAGGTLSILNVPQNYTPGQTYPIQVSISKSGQQRWGFELAARVASSGQQAGSLSPIDANTQVTSFGGIQYIEHTSAGTFLGTAKGTWTFNWTAPATPVGTISFAAAGNAANGNFSNSGDFIYTTTATSNFSAPNPITLLFPQVVIGGGYHTVFNLMNTGDSAISGDLFLTQQNGTPMTAQLGSVIAASIPISIPPGGMQGIIAAPINETDPISVGWVKVQSVGGSPGGVATFQFSQNGSLQTAVGVLSSNLVNAVTIPISDNAAQAQFTGYAIANPGTQNVNIRIVLVDKQGVAAGTIRPAAFNPLPPSGQAGGFLYQDLNAPNFTFDGSIVVIADGTGQFSMVALVQNQGLLTAIPVIPGKTSGIN